MRMVLGVMESPTENVMNEGMKYEVPSFFVFEDYVGCLLLACSHGVLTRHCTIFDANVRALYVDM